MNLTNVVSKCKWSFFYMIYIFLYGYNTVLFFFVFFFMEIDHEIVSMVILLEIVSMVILSFH